MTIEPGLRSISPGTPVVVKLKIGGTVPAMFTVPTAVSPVVAIAAGPENWLMKAANVTNNFKFLIEYPLRGPVNIHNWLPERYRRPKKILNRKILSPSWFVEAVMHCHQS